jgi:hypothetical protein
MDPALYGLAQFGVFVSYGGCARMVPSCRDAEQSPLVRSCRQQTVIVV